MPIFEYRCNDCNNKFEILHLSKENIDEIICPNCNSKNYKKLFSKIAKPISDDADFGNSDFGADDYSNYSGPSCCSGGMCGCN